MSSLQKVIRNINEANGECTGVLITHKEAYENYEQKYSKGIRLFLHSKDSYENFIPGESFEKSAICKLLNLKKEKGEYFSVISLPDSMDSYDLYWFLSNIGTPLTGQPTFSGNVFHICSNSVSQFMFEYINNPTDSAKEILFSGIALFNRVLGYILQKKTNDWFKAFDALKELLDMPTSSNILRPVITMIILSKKGYPINNLDVLCKIFISIGRTYHDCKTNSSNKDAFDRIYIFFVLVELLNGLNFRSIDEKYKEDLFSEINNMDCCFYQAIISLLVKKVLTKTSDDVAEIISDILFEILSKSTKKLKEFTVSSLKKELPNDRNFIVEGENLFKPLFEFPRLEFPVIVNSNSTTLTATVNDDQWHDVNLFGNSLPKYGTVNIYATHYELDSTPRLRIYSAEENKNFDWCKASHNGYSSAGGQGDGKSKPEILGGMHPVDKERFQHGEALMATIDIKNGHSSVKFHNWGKKFDLPFSTDSNSCIVIAFKGYSIKIVVEKEEISLDDLITKIGSDVSV